MRSVRWLWSQAFGVLCLQSAVLLLAIGSLVLVATREGASRGVAMDDLRAFFEPISLSHLWFYALFVVLLLLALNVTICTIQSVVQKLRAGVRRVAAFGPSVIHFGFLLALVSHLVSGFWGREGGTHLVTRRWTPLGEGKLARLERLEVESLEDGTIRAAEARLVVRDHAATQGVVLGYNEPHTSDFGQSLLLLIRPIPQSQAVVVSQRYAPGHPWALMAAILVTLGLATMWRRFLPAKKLPPIE